MAHEHDLDHLYPADAEVLCLYEGEDGGLRLSVAVPCPDCDRALELDAAVRDVEEIDLDVPLEDAADYYD